MERGSTRSRCQSNKKPDGVGEGLAGEGRRAVEVRRRGSGVDDEPGASDLTQGSAVTQVHHGNCKS